MEKVFENITEEQVSEVVDYLVSRATFPGIITFTGDLGAGKTTLVKSLVKALGSEDPVSSPTFALVNEYHTRDGKLIYHSDWYRIKNLEELFDAGIEEYVDHPAALLLVEWPEIGESILADLPCISVILEHLDEQRNYRIKSHE